MRNSIQRLLLAAIALGAPAMAEYVDSRACAGCHRQIAEDYARTGMGRSFSLPGPADATQGEFYHALSDTHFAMTRRDGQAYQRRWQIGLDGKETHVEELKVDYVMGSGNQARSYLHRTPRGTLIELPLGWYSEGGGHWGMSPGSDSERPRTRRFISYRCMSCHNGNPQIPAGHEAPGSDPVYVGNLPMGIDCQRCHGPGGEHIRAVGQKARRATIVNPARLEPVRRMEVCLQCHLETTSGRIPSAIVRFDRGPFSFTPGEPLDAFLLAFDHAPGTGHEGKFEAVGAVYRLRQSACFLKSAGKLTCESCHNPHRAPRGVEAIAHYAKACRQCHATLAANHPKTENCAECHMPKRRAEDTPGMVMTDHLIQRGPPQGDRLAALREKAQEEYRGEVVPYYPSPLPQSPANALYAAVAQVGLKNNLVAGLPALAREVAQQKPKEAEFYSVLGEGLRSAGKQPEAIAAYERAVQLNPRPVAALRSLAAMDGARAVELLTRALSLAPGDPITWYQWGRLEAAAGRWAEAAEKMRRAIALDPTLPEQSRGLAEVLWKAGQAEGARAALTEALRVDPYDDAAWNLQGRLLTDKGEMREALYSFEKASRLNPSEAAYHYDHALALARAGRIDEAFVRVQEALKRKADFADGYELLGGLHQSAGQMAEAERAYRRVLELRPEPGRIHLRLGQVLALRGDRAGAAEWFRKAQGAKDPAVARQATEALGGLR